MGYLYGGAFTPNCLISYVTVVTVSVGVFVTGIQNSQEITHERNLVGAEAEAEAFLDTIAELADRLGPLLVQLPPSFEHHSPSTLERFLEIRRTGR